MDTLLQDLRYALRTQAKSPGFTVIAVLTLTLGIGATAAIFTVVNAALLRPLPYPHSDRLVQVVWRNQRFTMDNVTDLEAQYWSEHTRAFEAVSTYDGKAVNLAAGAEPPEQTVEQMVTDQFFDVLGVHPVLGRDFSPADDRPGGPHVAVISDGLWERRFGRRSDVLGETITLDDVPYTVIGVLPSSFTYVGGPGAAGPPGVASAAPAVWIPRQVVADPKDQGHNASLFARLRDGVTFEQARDDVRRLDASFRNDYPSYLFKGEIGADLMSYRTWIARYAQPPLLVLLGAALLVLLIAAANVANLLVARQASRETEMAVRLSLGASGFRLFRQIATECLALTIVGGVAGVLLAYWAVHAVLALSPVNYFPVVGALAPDARVIGFSVGLVVVVALLMAVAAALHLRRLDVNRALREGGRTSAGGARQRFRNLLTAGEFAISLVLLAGALLLLTSLVQLSRLDPGFKPANLWSFRMMLPAHTYGGADRVWRFEQQVSDRLRALPGVEAVTTTSNLPMEYGFNFGVGVDAGGQQRNVYIQARAVSPGYFSVLGIAIVQGRALDDADTANSERVAVVNEAFVRECCAGRSAIGAQVGYGGQPSLAAKLHVGGPVRIVGVTADTRLLGLSQETPPTLFVPQAQLPDAISDGAIGYFPPGWILKTRTPPSLATIQRLVAQIDPNEPVTDLQPMSARIAASIGPQTFMSTLVGSFAGLALLLAAIGLYGVIAYSVAQRGHEIGVRMALGASSAAVSRMIVRQGLKLAIAGGAAGLLIAAGVTRFLRSFLFGVTPLDPYVFAGLIVVLLLVAVAASLVPARRASRVDPAVALRN